MGSFGELHNILFYTSICQGLTVVGWIASIVGVLISLAIAEPILAALGRIIGWAVVGAVGSIVQYLVLRQHFLWANRWVLATALGVTIGMAFGEAVFEAVARALISAWGGPATGDSGLSAAARVMDKIVAGVAGLAVGGAMGLAIYGAITGGVLVWVLRHPRRTEHN